MSASRLQRCVGDSLVKYLEMNTHREVQDLAACRGFARIYMPDEHHIHVVPAARTWRHADCKARA